MEIIIFVELSSKLRVLFFSIYAMTIISINERNRNSVYLSLSLFLFLSLQFLSLENGRVGVGTGVLNLRGVGGI